MDKRQQKLILDRTATLFPATATADPRERGMRLLEEAAETAQAMGVELLPALAVLQRVYSRAAGAVSTELGQCYLVLAAAAEACSIDLEKAGQEALNVHIRPSEERLAKWAINERDKLAAGIAIARDNPLTTYREDD